MTWKYAHADGTRKTFSNIDELKKHLPMPCGKRLVLDFDEIYSKSRLIQKARQWGGQVWSSEDDANPLFEITKDEFFITKSFN